jgi:putative membrane protein
MAHQTEATPAQSSNDSPAAMDASTRFSFERTILSHERTLMAWVRTATSLITFGFSLYKFFQIEQGFMLRPRTHQVIGPREFAMLMSAIGSFALVFATIQHWQYRKNLRKQQKEMPFSLSLLVAGLITALGLLATMAAIFRW